MTNALSIVTFKNDKTLLSNSVVLHKQQFLIPGHYDFTDYDDDLADGMMRAWKAVRKGRGASKMRHFVTILLISHQ